jgi:teichuronic acid exporter
MMLVVARLLTPADFGVVAAATVLISLSQAVANGGFGRAIVQRQSDLPATLNVPFRVTLGIGVILAILLCLLAPSLSVFFRETRIHRYNPGFFPPSAPDCNCNKYHIHYF